MIGGSCDIAAKSVNKWRWTVSPKEQYLATMESEIKKWDAAVDQLTTNTLRMSAETCAVYETQVKAMRDERDLGLAKLQDLHSANELAGQHMQAGVDEPWTSMKDALDKAASQYK